MTGNEPKGRMVLAARAAFDWAVAQEHFDDITDAIHQKILGDDIEPDGSILERLAGGAS